MRRFLYILLAIVLTAIVVSYFWAGYSQIPPHSTDPSTKEVNDIRVTAGVSSHDVSVTRRIVLSIVVANESPAPIVTPVIELETPGFSIVSPRRFLPASIAPRSEMRVPVDLRPRSGDGVYQFHIRASWKAGTQPASATLLTNPVTVRGALAQWSC